MTTPVLTQTHRFEQPVHPARARRPRGSFTLLAGARVLAAGACLLLSATVRAAPEAAPSPPAANKPPVATKPPGATKYTCPMHPEVIADQPGRCPKCGMKLVPKDPVAPGDKK